MDSKRKKTYAALLVVGFLALAADQFFFSEPAPAAAQSGGTHRSTTKAAPDAAGKGEHGAAMSVTAAPFPRPAEGDFTTTSLRDAFGLTPAAYTALQGPPEGMEPGPDGSPVQRPEQKVPAAAQFAEQHRLTAVLTGGEVSVAIVDEQWIAPGQTLDECMLVEITGRTASFQCRDGVARLQIEIAGQPAPP